MARCRRCSWPDGRHGTRRCGELSQPRPRLRGQHDRQRDLPRLRPRRGAGPVDLGVADRDRSLFWAAASPRDGWRALQGRRLELLRGALAVQFVFVVAAYRRWRPRDVTRFVLIALLAFAMGIQNATARRLAVAELTTTVLTMTLTGIAADSTVAGGAGSKLGRRILAVAAMLLGGADRRAARAQRSTPRRRWRSRPSCSRVVGARGARYSRTARRSRHELPGRVPLGHGDLGPPGRGRQRQQRQLAARASARHRTTPRSRAMPATTTTATPATSRCVAELGLGRVPLLARVVAHRARGGRVLARGARALPAHARCLPRERPHADAHVPPLHLAALDRGRTAAGRSRGRRSCFARFCERAMRHLGDLVPVCLHDQRAQSRARSCTRCWASPSRRGDAGSHRPVRTRTAPGRRGPAHGAPALVRGDQGRARRTRSVGLTVGMTAWEAEPGGEETMARLRAQHRGRLPRGRRGRLHRRPELHGPARRARTGRSSSTRTPSARRWATAISPRPSVPRSGARWR